MATITQTRHQLYNIEELLQIHNPAKGRWSCVGYAPSKHRRCQNPIALHNRTAASALLRTLSLSHGTSTGLQIRHTLLEIAGYLLCRHYHHQDQASLVAAEWYTIIAANSPVLSPSGPPITPVIHFGVPQDNTAHILSADPGFPSAPITDHGSNGGEDSQHSEPQAAGDTLASHPVPIQPSRSTIRSARAPFIAAIEAQERLRRAAEAEIARLQQESEAEQRRGEREEEGRRLREAERAEYERLERERIRREAEERAERQRAEQRRIEREQAQAESRARQILLQRMARREQQNPASPRSVSEERSQDQREWAASWSRYERDWENMSRIDTSGLDEDVRDSLPWPVRSGHWQDVNVAAVRCFFDNAPHTVPRCQPQIRSLQLLRLQVWRWHEDRLRHLFLAIADNPEVARLTTMVMQTINAMMDEIRSA